MTGAPLVFMCLAVLVQFYGILSKNDCIDNEINKIHRFKRNHGTSISDNIHNTTNFTKQDKTDIEESKIDVSNKKREKSFSKRQPKVEKDRSNQADSKINKIKKTEKITTPKNSLHFIEDIDEESPITHIQVKEPRLKEKPVKDVSKNETSKVPKPMKKDKIESKTKNVLPKNILKEETNKLTPQFKTVETKNDKKAIVNVSSDLIGQSTNESANTTKEKPRADSIASIRKSTENDFDDQNHESESSIIEIKEHKYEEEIVRFYPTKSCQPNAKRHWDASQNYNPQFSNSLYIPAMNSYQGLSQGYPYQKNTYNKDKHYSSYTCANYIDPHNGNYFYANFDDQCKQAEDRRRFQGYGDYNRIRKTWVDRNTKIKTPGKPDRYEESNARDSTYMLRDVDRDYLH